MKKQLIFGAAFAAAFALAGLNHVSAATGNGSTTANSDATFTISGQDGKLTLDSVPGFEFAGEDLSALISSGLKQTDEGDDPLTVTDLTGSSAGWNVSATLGNFTDGAQDAPSTLDGGTLTFAAATQASAADAAGIYNANSAAGTGITFGEASLTAGATTGNVVESAPADAGQGTTTTSKISGDLAIAAQAKAKAATYTAPITWTVAAGPAGIGDTVTPAGE